MNKLLMLFAVSILLISFTSASLVSQYLGNMTGTDPISSTSTGINIGVKDYISLNKISIYNDPEALNFQYVYDRDGNLLYTGTKDAYGDIIFPNGTLLLKNTNYKIVISWGSGVKTLYINSTFGNSLPKLYSYFNVTNLTLNGVVTSNPNLYGIDDVSFYTNIFNMTNITYTKNTIENQAVVFKLNVSYDQYQFSSIGATLVYNNTLYPSTKIINDDGNITFTNYITTPSLSANANITFYWNITSVNNGVTNYFISEYNNQSVLNFVIDDCTTGTYKIVNFSISDEDTLVRLKTPTYNQSYTAEIYLNNLLVYAKNKTNVNEIIFCSNIPITNNYTLDLTLKYDPDGDLTTYVSEYYHIQNFDLNSYTTNRNISLYSLLTTRSEECLFNLKGTDYLPLSQALIELNRKYLSDGSYKVVEIPKTDSLGQTISHMVLNDETYTIYIKKNGILLATYQDVKAIKPTGSDCIINLNVQGSSINPSSFINFGDLSYIKSYNPDTRTYSVTYTVPSGTSKNISLIGYLSNAYQNETVCSQSITATSGTIDCVISTVYENSSVLIRLYDSGNEVFTETFNVDYKRTEVLGKFRYILLAFLLPMFPLMVISSPAIALIFFVAGLILSVSVFLLDTQSVLGSSSFITWIIIGAVILIWKISTGGQKNG